LPNFNIAFALPQLPNEQSKRAGGFRRDLRPYGLLIQPRAAAVALYRIKFQFMLK